MVVIWENGENQYGYLQMGIHAMYTTYQYAVQAKINVWIKNIISLPLD